MKAKIYPQLFWASILFYSIGSNAQANQTLSNLTSPTAVNQSLIPGSNNSIDLGNSSLEWRNIYFTSTLNLNGGVAMQMPYTGAIGNANFYVGYNAGNSNTTTTCNTAIGLYALNNINNVGSAAGNTAVGYYSMYSTSTGTSNAASGYKSLYNNTTGNDNAAFGDQALIGNTTGGSNTAVGFQANYFNSTGTQITGLGAGTYTQYSNLTNCTMLGATAVATASNQVRVGNTGVTSIGGQVGWTTFSDGRYKKNIKENIEGLAFINSLRPISYTIDAESLNSHLRKGKAELPQNLTDYLDQQAAIVSKIVCNGFVAQEVEEAAKKLNFEFSGVDKPKNEDDLYGLRYDNFVVPLVKAVQELSKMNDEKNLRIDSLQEQINELRNMLLSKNANGGSSIIGASLDQNIPNPYAGVTTIGYTLPQGIGTAKIVITDNTGKIIKSVSVSGLGKNTITVDTSVLSAGTYNYSLVIDEQYVSTKRMVLIK